MLPGQPGQGTYSRARLRRGEPDGGRVENEISITILRKNFSIWRPCLRRRKDTELFAAFEQLQRERIGVGKHDEFLVLLGKLQETYLM